MARRHNCAVLGGLLLTVALMTAACSSGDTHRTTVQRATVTYTCCRAADVDPLRHPGDVVLLHWTTSSGATSESARPIPVTLAVTLGGPYDSVTQLKGGVSAGPSSPVAETTPIHTTDQAQGAPVSRLVIPSTAREGFYDLQASIKEGGGTLIGGSVIHVTTR